MQKRTVKTCYNVNNNFYLSYLDTLSTFYISDPFTVNATDRQIAMYSNSPGGRKLCTPQHLMMDHALKHIYLPPTLSTAQY